VSGGGATILAISGDKEATQDRFRREIGAPFGFVADRKGEIISLYGVKAPLVTIAKRTTFVIGAERRVLHVDTGGSAIDPDGAIAACKLF